MKLLELLFRIYFLPALFVLILQDVQAVQNPKGQDNSIRIGLLIPDQNSTAARYGAEMAIREANERGGFNGKPFRLIVRSMEGPWGTGSKMAVDLIFEEKVLAIMGSHDGRNAHLVEQVCVKVRSVFLSAWTGDPTLSKAFVPWYFSCVPNDLQRADALIEEIYNQKQFTKIAAVSDNGYDSKLAMESFLKELRIAGKTDPLHLFYNDSTLDVKALLDQIIRSDVSGIILFGKPAASVKLIQKIRQKKMNLKVFGSLSLLDENELPCPDLKNYERVVLVSPVNFWAPKYLAFRKKFQLTYGNVPGAVASYAYDGMSLLIEAIRTAGPDGDEIQKALKKINFEGVTGLIKFDEKGNRVGEPGLMEIVNGIPMAPGK